VIVAGPVFAEWYWAPVLFAIVFGPFILATAAILTGVLAYWARRRGKRLPWFRSLGLFVGLTVGLSLLVIGGMWAKNHIKERRIIASRAAAITFQTYEPSWVFTDYDAVRVRPLVIPQRQSVEFSYRRGDDYVYAAQSPSVSPVNPSEAGCGGRPKGLTSGETVGSCRTVVTESGQVVYLTNLEMNHLGNSVAIIELGGTRVDVMYTQLPDEAAVRYLDSLEPVAPEDMDYFGGYD
jgi:hypothetical protein